MYRSPTHWLSASAHAAWRGAIHPSMAEGEADMMLNWNEYRQQVLSGVGVIGRLSPDTVKGYMGLSTAGQRKDLLGAKMRELIALAVSVTVCCDGCIAVHTDAAIKHSATEKKIAEALGVAITRHARTVLEAHDASGARDAAAIRHAIVAEGHGGAA